MKLLVVTSRYPEAQRKGDQTRSYLYIKLLSGRHSVRVVTSGRPSSDEAVADLSRFARVERISVGPVGRFLSAVGALTRGTPAQVGWMMPRRAWTAASEAASWADVALVSTVRSIRGPLSAPTVVDHVDALSLNMSRRARGPESRPIRVFARLEAHLLSGWEARVATWIDGQIVTTAEDGAALPQQPPIAVVPQAWDREIGTEGAGERDIDIIFTGNMRYPPNRDAARMFATEILPLVRAKRPFTSAWVVGRDAKGMGLDGVTIASDVPDLFAYLRRAKVAIAPLRIGTGSATKVLEAAANGAAVITSPAAADRYGMATRTATKPAEYAREILRLLDDDEARSTAVRDARRAVLAHTASSLVPRVEGQLEAARRRRH